MSRGRPLAINRPPHTRIFKGRLPIASPAYTAGTRYITTNLRTLKSIPMTSQLAARLPTPSSGMLGSTGGQYFTYPSYPTIHMPVPYPSRCHGLAWHRCFRLLVSFIGGCPRFPRHLHSGFQYITILYSLSTTRMVASPPTILSIMPLPLQWDISIWSGCQPC